jgi:hypothetical protein
MFVVVATTCSVLTRLEMISDLDVVMRVVVIVHAMKGLKLCLGLFHRGLQ